MRQFDWYITKHEAFAFGLFDEIALYYNVLDKMWPQRRCNPDIINVWMFSVASALTKDRPCDALHITWSGSAESSARLLALGHPALLINVVAALADDVFEEGFCCFVRRAIFRLTEEVL